MNSWETILDQYLEGAASRAEAESLRFRLSLSEGERTEIETALRLSDQLLAAGESVVVPPLAVERLRARLTDYVSQNPAPTIDWERVGSTYQPNPLRLPSAMEADAEEIANAIIDGEAGVLPDGISDSSLNAFREIAAAARDPAAQPPIPAGAESRVLDRLREHRQSEAGSCDPAVARRILRQLNSSAAPASSASDRLPDILAATKDEEDEGKPK